MGCYSWLSSLASIREFGILNLVIDLGIWYCLWDIEFLMRQIIWNLICKLGDGNVIIFIYLTLIFFICASGLSFIVQIRVRCSNPLDIGQVGGPFGNLHAHWGADLSSSDRHLAPRKEISSRLRLLLRSIVCTSQQRFLQFIVILCTVTGVECVQAFVVEDSGIALLSWRSILRHIEWRHRLTDPISSS